MRLGKFGSTIFNNSILQPFDLEFNAYMGQNTTEILDTEGYTHSFIFDLSDYCTNGEMFLLDHNLYYGYSVYRFVTYNFLVNRHIRFKKELLQKTDQHINTIDSPLPFEVLYKTKDADYHVSYKIELKGKKFIRRISLYN